MKKKVVYIPIEVKVRELASQTLLAGELAVRGVRVYLGSKGAVAGLLRTKTEFGGTFLFKSGAGINYFQKLREYVENVAILDQEMSPILQDGAEAVLRFSSAELEEISRHYFVADRFTSAIENSVSEPLRGRAVTSGWPRIDLWHAEYRGVWASQVRQITQKFPEFLLFSSDFGSLSARDIRWRLQQKHRWDEMHSIDKNLDDYEHFDQLMRQDLKDFKAVVEFIRALDQDTLVPPVVVRPHPAEDHSRWRAALAGTVKTKLVYAGDITPWIEASVGVLHRGCTSAFQARMMGKRVMLVGPAASSDRVSPVAASLSTVVNTPADIRKVITEDYLSLFPDKTPDLGSRVEVGAATRIAEDLTAMTSEFEVPSWNREARSVRGTLGGGVRQIQGIKSWMSPSERIPRSAARNKLPGGITAEEVWTYLADLNLAHLEVNSVGSNLVVVEEKYPS